jgi:hypothetical protein
MKVVALAMILTVSQTFAPVPRQASNSAAGGDQGVQRKSDSKQKPAKAPPLVNPITSKENQGGSNTPGEADTQNTVVIREPVTVSELTSWWTRLYVIFTGLLVVIAFAGVWAALRTLSEIREQVKVGKISAEAAKQSAQLANRNIQVLIEKERARIRVDSVGIRLVGMDVRRRGPPRESDRIEFQVFCYGVTSAFVLESRTDTLISESAEESIKDWGCGSPMFLPKVLNPSDKGINRDVPIDPEIDQMVEFPPSPGTRYTSFFLHFRAFIRCTDVFQTTKQWEMESRYVWNITYHHGAQADAFFSWTNHSQQDTERETEVAS